ncbi:MAG: cell division ATPase MinD [Candidatus Diapherotrites archaeon]|nr:cell division ATPase MinD [Candidatus Diapherotrites archaeon]
MTRIIAISSGKGGVGKTSLTANLGISLGKLGKKVLMVDVDIQMANLALMVGMEGRPITIQDILVGEANALDGIYDVAPNVKLMPAKLSTEKLEKIPGEAFSSMISTVIQAVKPDIILLDTAPGMDDETIIPLSVANEVLVVTMAEPVSVADSMKIISLAEGRLSKNITGAVINMVKGLEGEMSKGEIEKALGVDIVGVVPEDAELRKYSLEGKAVAIEKPDCPASIAIMAIASKLTGIAPPIALKPKKKSIFSSLFGIFKGLGKRKPKLPPKQEMMGNKNK